MTATQKTPSSASRKSASTAPDEAIDAIQLLTDDHSAVKKLFKAYQKLVDAEASVEEKQAVAQEICLSLKVHALLEEEIFYPAVRNALDAEELLDEAEVEHASAKDLIDQIESMSPHDDLYDAKVTVLGEYINHHVKEEESEMFPQVRESDLDVKSLGDQMESRQAQLVIELTQAEQPAG